MHLLIFKLTDFCLTQLIFNAAVDKAIRYHHIFFILSAEMLSIKIRNNKNIKGITIDNIEYKLSQFVDDTSLLLDGSEQSLNKTLQELDNFYILSGLKLNCDKTKIVWIGSKKYSTHSIKTRWKLDWDNSAFKILGLWFHVDLDRMVALNYKETMIN